LSRQWSLVESHVAELAGSAEVEDGVTQGLSWIAGELGQALGRDRDGLELAAAQELTQ
jgi:hypothetical protein